MSTTTGTALGGQPPATTLGGTALGGAPKTATTLGTDHVNPIRSYLFTNNYVNHLLAETFLNIYSSNYFKQIITINKLQIILIWIRSGGSSLGGPAKKPTTLGGTTSLGGSTLGGSTLGGSSLGGTPASTGSSLGGSSLGGSSLGGSTLGGAAKKSGSKNKKKKKAGEKGKEGDADDKDEGGNYLIVIFKKLGVLFMACFVDTKVLCDCI